MNPVAMSEGFAVHGLHQKQLEIIWRTQILRHTRLTDRFLPEERAGLPTQPIPALLVIIHDGTEKIPFEFLKGHGSRLGRRFGIVNAVAGVGQAPLKALGHPAKQRFDGPFGRRTIRRRLLRDDTQSIHQHLTCSLRREDFPSIMEDDRRFARTGPGVLTARLKDEAIFRLQCHLDQAHVILFLEGA